jgi:heme-degrading monooxygenase HmoA
MTEIVTTGVWRVRAENEAEFIQAWEAFANWARELEGSGALRLTRDMREEGRFVSFAPWANDAAVRAWKGSPEFSERLGRVRQHVEDFEPTELETVVVVEPSEARV